MFDLLRGLRAIAPPVSPAGAMLRRRTAHRTRALTSVLARTPYMTVGWSLSTGRVESNPRSGALQSVHLRLHGKHGHIAWTSVAVLSLIMLQRRAPHTRELAVQSQAAVNLASPPSLATCVKRTHTLALWVPSRRPV